MILGRLLISVRNLNECRSSHETESMQRERTSKSDFNRISYDFRNFSVAVYNTETEFEIGSLLENTI